MSYTFVIGKLSIRFIEVNAFYGRLEDLIPHLYLNLKSTDITWINGIEYFRMDDLKSILYRHTVKNRNDELLIAILNIDVNEECKKLTQTKTWSQLRHQVKIAHNKMFDKLDQYRTKTGSSIKSSHFMNDIKESLDLNYDRNDLDKEQLQTLIWSLEFIHEGLCMGATPEQAFLEMHNRFHE